MFRTTAVSSIELESFPENSFLVNLTKQKEASKKVMSYTSKIGLDPEVRGTTVVSRQDDFGSTKTMEVYKRISPVKICR